MKLQYCYPLTAALTASLFLLSGCGGGDSDNSSGGNGGGGSQNYTVTATAGSGGSITPATRTVQQGQTTTFTVTPDTGYSISTVSGCNGSLSGNIYTTGAITSACSVVASFSLNSYTIAAAAGEGGSITSSSQSVQHGQTATFTITPNAGYSITDVTGCNGSLSGNIYTTGAITNACTVTVSFSINSYTVTATAGDGGSITPASQTVNHGATTSFTITPNAGYSIENVTGCGGSLSDDTYTTGVITEACEVNGYFQLSDPDGSAFRRVYFSRMDLDNNGIFEVTQEYQYDTDGNLIHLSYQYEDDGVEDKLSSGHENLTSIQEFTYYPDGKLKTLTVSTSTASSDSFNHLEYFYEDEMLIRTVGSASTDGILSGDSETLFDYQEGRISKITSKHVTVITTVQDIEYDDKSRPVQNIISAPDSDLVGIQKFVWNDDDTLSYKEHAYDGVVFIRMEYTYENGLVTEVRNITPDHTQVIRYDYSNSALLTSTIELNDSGTVDVISEAYLENGPCRPFYHQEDPFNWVSPYNGRLVGSNQFSGTTISCLPGL